MQKDTKKEIKKAIAKIVDKDINTFKKEFEDRHKDIIDYLKTEKLLKDINANKYDKIKRLTENRKNDLSKFLEEVYVSFDVPLTEMCTGLSFKTSKGSKIKKDLNVILAEFSKHHKISPPILLLQFHHF